MRCAGFALLAAVAATGIVACGDDGPTTLKLVAYDSFPTEGTPLNDALTAFTKDTGIEVQLVIAGDAGTMVAKAGLTAGNPEGDVMWGVDNTLMSAAVDGDVFEGDPTPVDTGDVCVNYDIAWFDEHGIDPPMTLADLAGYQALRREPELFWQQPFWLLDALRELSRFDE